MLKSRMIKTNQPPRNPGGFILVHSYLFDLGELCMKQARTLDDREFRRVLDYVASRTHAARNRAMLMMTFYGGFRVGEIAQLVSQTESSSK